VFEVDQSIYGDTEGVIHGRARDALTDGMESLVGAFTELENWFRIDGFPRQEKLVRQYIDEILLPWSKECVDWDSKFNLVYAFVTATSNLSLALGPRGALEPSLQPDKVQWDTVPYTAKGFAPSKSKRMAFAQAVVSPVTSAPTQAAEKPAEEDVMDDSGDPVGSDVMDSILEALDGLEFDDLSPDLAGLFLTREEILRDMPDEEWFKARNAAPWSFRE